MGEGSDSDDGIERGSSSDSESEEEVDVAEERRKQEIYDRTEQDMVTKSTGPREKEGREEKERRKS